MKVPVVQYLAAAGVHQRVFGCGVQLHVQHLLDVAERLHGRAVHLRHGRQPIGVLDAGAQAGGVRAQKLAEPLRDGVLAGVRPFRLHWLGIRLRGAGQGEMAERGNL